MIFITLITILFDTVITQSITVSSGVVIVNGLETKVGMGTFIPAPLDADLAKKLLEKNTEIDVLKSKINTCETKFSIMLSSRIEREGDIDKYWRSKYNDLEIENLMLKGWWNRWGKTAIWCAISAVAGAIISWEAKDYIGKD